MWLRETDFRSCFLVYILERDGEGQTVFYVGRTGHVYYHVRMGNVYNLDKIVCVFCSVLIIANKEGGNL